MKYYTSVTNKGTMRYRDVPGSIGVMEAPDNPMPIGVAHCRGPDASGLAEFRLIVRGQPVAGVFRVVDGEFVPVVA